VGNKIVMKGRSLGNMLNLARKGSGRTQSWEKHIVTSL
jgi:hypothetical protein